MHLKALPSSSAWVFPIGVNSPPHLRISSKVGFFESAWGGSAFVFLPLNFFFISMFRLSFRDFNWSFRLMPEKCPYLEKMQMSVFITCMRSSWSVNHSAIGPWFFRNRWNRWSVKSIKAYKMVWTYISSTLFICINFAGFSRIFPSSPFCASCRRSRVMSRTSCSCLGALSFSLPSSGPPYFSKRSNQL